MPLTDRNLNCIECKQPFVFTVGEQEFHASKGFTNEPSRCPACRAARKAAGGGGGGGGFSDRGGSRGGGGFGGGDGGRREMHDAICAECGKDTQVPFVPSGARPVYCRDCYSKQSGGGGGRSSYGGGGGRSKY